MIDPLWFPVKPFNPKEFLVLIVDDVRSNLKVVGAILDRVGYSTTFATSGQQAFERMKKSKPDLILLDVMMPEMDGIEVCKQIKGMSQYEEIPIIFVTASHENKTIMEAFEQGAVDYITKPFNSGELLARVKIHLELKYTRDELKKTLISLNTLATIDGLTGVFNRRHLFILAEQEFNRVRRYGSAFSVFILDVDHFKQINDNYGHNIGDETLKSLAITTQNLLRKVDLFGRFGGEEFVGFLPETDIEQALKVAERIRQTIANLHLEFDSKILPITVSIGLATYVSTDPTIDEMLKRADLALYEAKRGGRNQVVVYDEHFSK